MSETTEQHRIQLAIQEHGLKNVLRMEKQLTYEECERLLARFDRNAIWMVLKAMNNWKPLARKNVSVYDTCVNWLGRQKVFTEAAARSWLDRNKVPHHEFGVYFAAHSTDPKTNTKLFMKRI